MKIQIDIPTEIVESLVAGVTLPRMVPVRLPQPTPDPLPDLPGAVRAALGRDHVLDRLPAGGRVAIGVGSRGIGDLPVLVRTVVAALQEVGAKPFIVPAMGSHGGATAEGQRAVLEHLGVTEAAVGAPVESSMEVREIGRTADGMPVFLDRLAWEADAITFVARVKPHTAFRGPYESGLAKMIAIGLGKQAGAAATHAAGFGRMAENVPAMATVALAQAPILFGLAVLENAHDRAFRVEAVPSAEILEREPALLESARAAMPRLPFPELDVLVIDRIGKNISGDGADPNITGRYPTPFASGGPALNKQVVLDLAAESGGNANGVGTADFTTARLASRMSFAATYPNALTSTVPRPVALPMVLPNDRLAVTAAVATCNAVGREPRVVRLVDTLHVSEILVSTSMLSQLPEGTAILGEPAEWPFDRDGALRDLGLVPGAAGGVA